VQKVVVTQHHKIVDVKKADQVRHFTVASLCSQQIPDIALTLKPVNGKSV